VLSLKTYGRTTWECASVGALVAVQVVTCIQLHARLCGPAFQCASALGVCQLGSEAQLAFLFLIEYIVVVVSVTKLNLLVISINLLADSLWLTEVEWCAFHLQDLTSRNSGVVGGQIEVRVDFADDVVNRRCGISGASNREEGVMCQVHDGLLVGGSQILQHQLVVVSEGELSFAARITDPKSGRTLECYTTEPGMQLYTANFATGYKGANGCTFPRRSAVCLEAQHFPDTPNRPYFPSVVLNPGQQYKQKTIYRFGVTK